jgi:hypothetical protein
VAFSQETALPSTIPDETTPPGTSAPATTSPSETTPAAPAAPAAAPPVPPAPAASPAVADEVAQSASAILDRARETYVLGDHARAQSDFEALIARDTIRGDVPPEVLAEAMIFLGEIRYMNGDRTGAEQVFRALLTQDPSTPIRPDDHPDFVIGIFEVVRASVLAERRAEPARLRPLPAWGFAPFGIPQIRRGQPVRGALAATFQVGFAAASVAGWVWVDNIGAQRAGVAPSSDEDWALYRKAKLVSGAFSAPAASLFYLTWGASVLDAGLGWRADQRAAAPTGTAWSPPAPRVHLAVGVAPRPAGLDVVIGGAW